jgi:hypothetical protein
MRPPNYPGETLESEKLTAAITYESALRDAGVNEALIAKKLKSLLEAKQQRWNPKKKIFDELDDYDIQLAAAKEIIKIFGGYPLESEGGGGTVMIDLGSLTPKEFRGDGREHCRADSKVQRVAPGAFGSRVVPKP